tara:strand:- start:562 stop:666 length:105 start_codon:yes stop_codon:yes gene_type:complete
MAALFTLLLKRLSSSSFMHLVRVRVRVLVRVSQG